MPDDVKTQNDEIVINASIDQILSNLPVGSIAKGLSNNLYGINFRQTGGYLPRDKSVYGFTFFTRPQLNLSRLNISNYRGLYNLLTDNELSYQRYTRLMLDPRLGYNDGVKSPLVDNLNAFIPVLTNNIVSLSGWPDLTVPTYTTDGGIYNEEHSMVDGVTNHYESYDLDITFKNTKGNPLIYMFYVWIKYESLVVEGVLNPYFDMIVENEIDYNTRIYRLVLDQTKRYVTYIACTGASFPINVPTGNLFDYNTDTPYNTKNSEINIRFRCMGFVAFEDIIKLWFNKALAIFNPEIKKILEHDLNSDEYNRNAARDDGSAVYRVPGSSYVKLPHYLAVNMDTGVFNNSYFSVNYRAYPYINLYTNELEWWVDETRFKESASKSFKERLEETVFNPEEEVGD